MVDLDFGNGFFLATATNGVSAISSDALHWRRFHSELTGYYVETSFLENEFAALVLTSAGTQLVSSTNGVDWTVRIPARKESLSAVVKGKGIYVSVGLDDSGTGIINGVILTSTNGTAWQSTYTTPLPVYGIAYGNGVFVAACGHEGGIYSSEDAITWTQRLPKTTGAYQSTAFGNGRFVAVGFERQSFLQPAEMASSSDGINWERRYSTIRYGVLSMVCHGSGVFVAAGPNLRAVSTDGLSWEETSLASGWTGLAFGNGKFVALSADDAVNLSTDGRAWQKLELTDLYAPSLAISTYSAGEEGLNVILSGRAGKQYAIEASQDFASWQLLTNGTGSISNRLVSTSERTYLRGKLIAP